MINSPPKLDKCKRVLIVEGYNDLLFLAEVLEFIGNLTGVFIKEMGGKKMGGKTTGPLLETFLTPALLSDKTAIGVIVDADENAAGTAQSLESQLSAITKQEIKNGEWTTGSPRIGLFVVPGGGRVGEIETLVWEAWSNDPANAGAKACVEAYLDCMGGHGLQAKSPDKGRVGAILSVLSDEDPRLGPGARDRAFDFKEPGAEPRELFDRPELEPLVEFLRKL